MTTIEQQPPPDEWLEELAERQLRLYELPTSSWDEVDISAVLAGDMDEAPPAFLQRTDEVRLIYRGKVSDIHGEPEACKGWFACMAVKDVLERGEHVIYFDFEDSAKGVVSRLQAMGVPADVLVDRFHYAAPEEPLNETTGLNLSRLLESYESVGLVVLDGLIQAMSNQGRDTNSNPDIADFYRILPRQITRHIGAAVLLIDHVTKDGSNGGYAIGGMTKLGAIDGASFFASVKKPFGRGREGHVRIYVAKDRPGYVRSHAGESNGRLQLIADMILVSTPDGGVTVRLEAPEQLPSDEDKKAAAQFIRRNQILEAIRNEPGATLRNIQAQVDGRQSDVRDAVRELIREGKIHTEDGPRGSIRHFMRDTVRDTVDECVPTSNSPDTLAP